ncbi:Hsp20/alpha crystallin family protein [Planctomicrobium piriforme]|uniref:Molecular chaperone IbpA, HSP20 family n=1 Tax=Planctomicrobium piriforme TaxID=1576369 RepID=A0A1I3QSW2_9PLAN|nr:Hsp20/alpha crystallin family protein [Planctomicrobium piriforme]SFJ37188.1 Molecular chaperone IbpA, HSP20 family [Planctomicrobium piriforme]
MNTTATQTTENAPQTQQEPANRQRPAPVQIRPAVDLIEYEHHFLLQVEMPGVDQSGVEVSLERNVLSVTGNAVLPQPAGSRLVSGDARPRVYERAFELSDDIDRDQIDAQVRNGLLTLTLPKSNRARKTTLTVKAG